MRSAHKQDQERALLSLYIYEQVTETQDTILAELPLSQKTGNSDTMIVILKDKEYSVLNWFP